MAMITSHKEQLAVMVMEKKRSQSGSQPTTDGPLQTEDQETFHSSAVSTWEISSTQMSRTGNSSRWHHMERPLSVLLMSFAPRSLMIATV